MSKLWTPPSVPPSPDYPIPGGANDYEFEATTSSLPSGFAWVNQGTSTYSEASGVGTIVPASSGGAGESLRLITKTLPAGNWTMTGKFGYVGARVAWSRAGFVLRESSSGKLVEFSGARDLAVGTGLFTVQKWTNTTTFSAITANSAVVDSHGPFYYLRIKKNSATSYDFLSSLDGVVYFTVASAIDLTAFLTINEFGFLAAHRTGLGVDYCYYIRFT